MCAHLCGLSFSTSSCFTCSWLLTQDAMCVGQARTLKLPLFFPRNSFISCFLLELVHNLGSIWGFAFLTSPLDKKIHLIYFFKLSTLEWVMLWLRYMVDKQISSPNFSWNTTFQCVFSLERIYFKIKKSSEQIFDWKLQFLSVFPIYFRARMRE